MGTWFERGELFISWWLIYKIKENNCYLQLFTKLIQIQMRYLTFLGKSSILTWRLFAILSQNFSYKLNSFENLLLARYLISVAASLNNNQKCEGWLPNSFKHCFRVVWYVIQRQGTYNGTLFGTLLLSFHLWEFGTKFNTLFLFIRLSFPKVILSLYF